MVFRPGQSGNPGGKREAKAVTDALWLAAKRTDKEGKTALNRMAEKEMACAVRGEPWAVHYITDRPSWKVPAPVAGSMEVGPSALFLHIIKAISAGAIPEGLTIEAAAIDNASKRS